MTNEDGPKAQDKTKVGLMPLDKTRMGLRPKKRQRKDTNGPWPNTTQKVGLRPKTT